MAKKNPLPDAPKFSTERVARFYHLLALLVKKPQTRDYLVQKLEVGVRKFYRDLEDLRQLGVDILLSQGKYSIQMKMDKALSLLPFPDPGLTFAEAEKLAKGRTNAHKKLRNFLKEIQTAPPKSWGSKK